MFKRSIALLTCVSLVMASLSNVRPVYSAEVAQAPVSSISLPCEESAGGGACQSLGLRPCAEVKKDTHQGIKDKLDKKIEAYYKGIDLDLNATQSMSQMQGKAYPTPTCNALDDENTTNKTGKDCGSLSSITVDAKKMKAWKKALIAASGIILAGVTFGASLAVTVPLAFIMANNFRHIDRVHINAKDQFGVKEAAYQRGAWIAGLKCYREQVLNEINAGKLSISEGNRAAAEKIQGVMDRHKKLIDVLANAPETQALCSDKSVANPEYCKGIQIQDTNEPRMLACYLKAARGGLESAGFADLAFTEILMRAEKSYSREIAQVRVGTEDRSSKNIGSMCAGKADSECNKKGCMERVINECYRQEYPLWAKNWTGSLYPTSGQCK